MTTESKNPRASLTRRIGRDFIRLVQLLIGFQALYALVQHVVSRFVQTGGGELENGHTLANGIAFVWLPPFRFPPVHPPFGPRPPAAPWEQLVGDILLCIAAGVITYAILKLVCDEEWVQEEVDFKECWEEIKWYNPFSWVYAVVCTIVKALVWVAKIICKYKEVVVTILVLACIVTVIVL